MTMEEITPIFDVIGYTYDHEHPEYVEDAKLSELALPFVELELEDLTFSADDLIYHTWQQLTVRLYTDTALRSEAELKVHRALIAAGFAAKKAKPAFLPELQLWETDFTMEV